MKGVRSRGSHHGFPRPRKSVAVALLLVCATAGCGGNRVKPGIFANAADTDRPPSTIGLLFPRVEAGAVERGGKWPGGRAFMASEISAVVHVRMLEELGKACKPAWKDLSADKTPKERMALLASVIHRDYSLSGAIPVRVAGELGRAAGVPACLLVSIIKFGPGTEKLEMKSLSGIMKPAATEDQSKSWIHCGVKLVVFRTPGGQILWEAGGLTSLPASDSLPGMEAGTQEAAAARVVAELMEAFPWRK